MKVTLEHIEKALELSGGFQSHAAQKLGISVQALNKRIQKSKRLQDTLWAIKEKYLDMTESKLLGMIKAGEPSAIYFYLKTQGKHRGYIEQWRGEVSGPGGLPVPIEYVRHEEKKS